MGEASALASALLWALDGILLRPQTRKHGAISLNGLQYLFAATFLVIISILSGRAFLLLEAPLASLVLVLAAALIGMVGGDTLYVASLGRLGVARTFPISNTFYLLLTSTVAILFLGETISYGSLLGAALAVGGVTLVALSWRGAEEVLGDLDAGGIAASLGAAVCWAIAILMLKVALVETDVIAVNTIRLPMVAALLLAINSLRRTEPLFRSYDLPTLAAVGSAGVFGVAVSSLLFLFAVQSLGAAKTAVLASTSPLFAVLLARVVLKERLTPGIIFGTVLSVAGIGLLSSSS